MGVLLPYNPDTVHIIPGRKIKTWGGWYRHDRVEVAGVLLEGHLQVRAAHGRVESTTHCRDRAVLGTAIDWLFREQQRGGD